jgi:hypothetical protein
MSPIPEYKLVFAAVRTTPSPGSSSFPMPFLLPVPSPATFPDDARALA